MMLYAGFDLSYVDNQNTAKAVLGHFCRTLLERGKTIDVVGLPVQRPGDLDKEAYATAVRGAMLAALPAPCDWHDWDNRRVREEWYGADVGKVD